MQRISGYPLVWYKYDSDCITATYDHRTLKTRLPVRSALTQTGFSADLWEDTLDRQREEGVC